MRSRTPPDLSNRCPRCWLQHGFCLCAEVPHVETATRLVFIRHALERWKTTNTVRVGMLALPNSELHEYGGPDQRLDEAVLKEPDTWLLFPGVEATAQVTKPPKRLVVVDGSWPQARKMVQRIDAFRGMPRLALPVPTERNPRLKRPPHAEGRSTLEAVADALALLEGAEKSAPLHALHALHVRRVISVRQSGGDLVRRLGEGERL